MSAREPSRPSPNDDEPALVTAAARGDTLAFRRLYERHVARVMRRLSHLMGPHGSIDDLVQDTFLRAMKSLSRFRGERPFLHWLLRIATSVARDEQRRARRSLWTLLTRPQTLDDALGSDARAEGYADLVTVHRALDQLSPRLREVVILFELEGESLAEIAVELRLPLHTVASRLRRGRERLRAVLRRSGYAEGVTQTSLMPVRERS
jgi:RNA polymerase sigma-70 factor (ECF subfamily)